jgi:large subunit ribosomal protein L23
MQNVLIKPVLSEKTLINAAKGLYTFSVDKRANKNQIADAVSQFYKVHVTQVKTIMVPGKIHRVGRKMNTVKKSDWKKAMVSLKKGETIAAFQLTDTQPEEKQK